MFNLSCSDKKWLTLIVSSDSSRISQLFMIRSKPGYLDRLVNSISDLNSQVLRAKARVKESELRVQEASAEQEIQATELIRCRNLCKELVGFMEKELTRICDRSVQIVGPVLDL
ncbi:unnamed protein product [Dicrocoelium dendriticum]|nr:unnamed protein product [Dicrocoelium dendriticum]